MRNVSRTHYLVLPSYQIRLVAFLVLIMLIGSLLHGLFLYRITARNIEEGFFSAHNRLRSTWEILKPAVVVTNGLSFLLVSLTFLLVTILLTHRLVGPMFKIAGRLKELANGRFDLAPVRLRRGDERGERGGTRRAEALGHATERAGPNHARGRTGVT